MNRSELVIQQMEQGSSADQNSTLWVNAFENFAWSLWCSSFAGCPDYYVEMTDQFLSRLKLTCHPWIILFCPKPKYNDGNFYLKWQNKHTTGNPNAPTSRWHLAASVLIAIYCFKDWAIEISNKSKMKRIWHLIQFIRHLVQINLDVYSVMEDSGIL